jgi:hypothetical protein
VVRSVKLHSSSFIRASNLRRASSFVVLPITLPSHLPLYRPSLGDTPFCSTSPRRRQTKPISRQKATAALTSCFLLAVDSESADSFLAYPLSLTSSMFTSERSVLARELRKPLPRPRDVTTQLWTPLQQDFHSAFARPAWRPPEAIAPNPDFLPRLLHDFYKFCEEHPDRGSDPLLLAGIQLARDDCASAALEGEVASIDFLTGVIFPSVTRALRGLEQNTGLRHGGYVTGDNDACAGIHILFQDGAGPETVTRAVFQAKSAKMGHDYFPKMDRMAQGRENFFSTTSELSIILSVSSYSCICAL